MKKGILLSAFWLSTGCVDAGKENDTSESDDTGYGSDVVVNEYCESLGLTSIDMDMSGISGDFGEIAPDFEFNTINNGVWRLSEQWTGCDNYIFVNYYQTNDYPVNLSGFGRIKELLELAPDNTHFFILNIDNSITDNDALMTDIWSSFVGAYNTMDEAEADWWRDHVHFVTDDGWGADWIGALNQQYYISGEFVLWSAAIDRQQRVREVGNYCDPSTGWEQCPPKFMAYESIYFNFEENRRQQMAATTAETYRVFDNVPVQDSGWAGARSYAEVTLPDAATMETFDTMELDMELKCAGYPAGTQCPAWDYLVYAYLCEVDDPTTSEDESNVCTKEFGRWITTYWRPGRWVHDATPMLAWLKDGGTRKIAFYSQQYYELTLDIRLSNQGKGYRPVQMDEIFTGGTFNDWYNWGSYHDLSTSEWRQWTEQPEQDVYAPANGQSEWNWQVKDETITYSIRPATLEVLTIQGQNDIFTIQSNNSTDGYLLLEGDSANVIGAGLYQRLDYAFTGDSKQALALCFTEVNATTLQEAEDATEHCNVDDPTNCSPRADSTDWTSGCNFGPWTLLSSPTGNTTVLEDDWVEERVQQYIVADNGVNNARHGGKVSRWDWVVDSSQFYFCHTVSDATDPADLEGLLETCSSDNANTDTVDESRNCWLQADSRDLERGCNGSAWRVMSDTPVTNVPPTGEYMEVWHEDKLPISFIPPSGTTRLELAAVVSGHGFGSDTENCAEFCDHQHRFWLQYGTEYAKVHPEAGTLMGCADQVQNGTVPNQSGTWIYGRSGWCPGMEVPVWRADMTNEANLNGENTINYLAMMNGSFYHPTYSGNGTNPNIILRSYLVYYQ